MQSPKFRKRKPQQLQEELLTDQPQTGSISGNLANAQSLLLQKTEPQLHSELSNSFVAFSSLLTNIISRHNSKPNSHCPSPVSSVVRRTTALTPARAQKSPHSTHTRARQHAFLFTSSPKTKTFIPVRTSKNATPRKGKSPRNNKAQLQKVLDENDLLKARHSSSERVWKTRFSEQEHALSALQSTLDALVEAATKLLPFCKQCPEKQHLKTLLRKRLGKLPPDEPRQDKLEVSGIVATVEATTFAVSSQFQDVESKLASLVTKVGHLEGSWNKLQMFAQSLLTKVAELESAKLLLQQKYSTLLATPVVHKPLAPIQEESSRVVSQLEEDLPTPDVLSKLEAALGSFYTGDLLDSVQLLMSGQVSERCEEDAEVFNYLKNELEEEQTNLHRHEQQIEHLKEYIRELEQKLKRFEEQVPPEVLRGLFSKVLRVSPPLAFEAEEAIRLLTSMLKFESAQLQEITHCRKQLQTS